MTTYYAVYTKENLLGVFNKYSETCKLTDRLIEDQLPVKIVEHYNDNTRTMLEIK